jgi:hypothetical protein
MFNHDAVEQDYKPKPGGSEFFVCVTVGTEDGFIPPKPQLAHER